jgi:SET domain-containing protein
MNQLLLTVGYDLTVGRDDDRGMGLVTRVHLRKGQMITQYEGCVLSKEKVRKMCEESGCNTGSHFATPFARTFVINGYEIESDEIVQRERKTVTGTLISMADVKGFGGGSFCNHDDNPNAQFIRSSKGDGLGIFVMAKRDIKAGEWISVNYNNQFLNSVYSNLIQ